VDSWTDQSPFGNNVTASGSARPTLAPSGTLGLPRRSISFDGVNDVLARTTFTTAGGNSTFSDITMFLVATPKSNAGGFRAFMSGKSAADNYLGSGTDGRDYRSGFTVDQGGVSTTSFNVLNLEGAKWSGQADVSFTTFQFNEFHVLSLDPTNDGSLMLFYADSIVQGSRSSAAATADMLDFRLGARYFDNDATATINPGLTGFLDGNIAAVLLYEGNLSDADRQSVESYLTGRFILGVGVPEVGSFFIVGLVGAGMAGGALLKKRRQVWFALK
jgi:hypothetical protein